MQKEVLEFYSSLRQIFTVCPCCKEIHRLSDCKLYQSTRPPQDWKDNLEKEIKRLESMDEKLKIKITAARILAKESGRKSADKLVKKIGSVFTPLKLNPKDAKVIFHPIDFLVFNGMNSNTVDKAIKQILLFDKGNKSGQNLSIQNSIEKTVQTKNYEWLTLRVDNDGKIHEEEQAYNQCYITERYLIKI